jgi:hypothetical protein
VLKKALFVLKEKKEERERDADTKNINHLAKSLSLSQMNKL